MQTLLNISDLKVWFPISEGFIAKTTRQVRAVDGVSLSIQPGETLGLVGESGCGKSTLARAIMQLEKITAGSICFEGQDIAALPRRELNTMRKQLQIVFQDPFSSLNPRMNIEDIITEGMLIHKMIRPREKRSEAIRLLQDVGLGEHALHRYPHEFSGGQRQRISIARALSLRPKLIICDEAVSALDVSIQAQIVNMLLDLRDKYGLAYLFISHDLSVVRHISDRLAVMYLGRIVEEGKAKEVIDDPRHPYTQALISAIPRIDPTPRQRITLTGDVPSPSNPPSGCHFHPRCPQAFAPCSTTCPQLTSIPDAPTRRVACLK